MASATRSCRSAFVVPLSLAFEIWSAWESEMAVLMSPDPAGVRGSFRAESEVGPAGDEEPSDGGRALPRLCLDLRLPLRFGLLHQGRLEPLLRLGDGTGAVALHRAPRDAQALRDGPGRPLRAREKEFDLGSREFRRGAGEQGTFRTGEAVHDFGARPGRALRVFVSHVISTSRRACGQRTATARTPAADLCDDAAQWQIGTPVGKRCRCRSAITLRRDQGIGGILRRCLSTVR